VRDFSNMLYLRAYRGVLTDESQITGKYLARWPIFLSE